MRMQLKIDYKASLWKMLKHLVSRLLVMRYGGNTTKYLKHIELPIEMNKDVLLAFISNPQVKDSLLIPKIYNHLFLRLKNFYEDVMS